MWLALSAFFFTVIVPLITHVLKAFGIGFVVFSGITLAINELRDYALTMINGLPADVLGIMGIMQIDVAFNMIISSVIASAVLKGLNSGTDTKKSMYF